MNPFLPNQFKFAQNPMSGLLRCQTFIGQWMIALTIWSSRVRPPFLGGPPFQPIQSSMSAMVHESCAEVLGFVQQLAASEFHISTLPAFSGDTAAAQAGQAAWSRLQAISFACGLIRTLEVADSCFTFGPHFSGGDNAAQRETYFGSLEQRAYAEQYQAAVSRLAAILSPPAENGTELPFMSFDRGAMDTFAEQTLPTARVTLQTAWEHCLKTIKMAGGFLHVNPESTHVLPEVLASQATMSAEFGDQILMVAEGLIDCIPSFVLALRAIGEDQLADILDSIAQT